MSSDLTIPNEALPLRDLVARAVAEHELCARARAAADLRQRAERLRQAPLSEDPLASSLMAFCHSQAGLVYSHPSHVAVVAYEAVAALLADPTRSNEEEETRGH
jgi:hypothetical protein